MYIVLGFLIIYSHFQVASSLCFKVRPSAKLLACTQTLFYFSFVLFENISELTSKASVWERAWSVRKKNKFFLFPHPYPLALAVSKSPVVYILSRALDRLWRENRGSVNRLPSYWYENDFFILMQMILIYTRKIVHIASFWKWEVLELGK